MPTINDRDIVDRLIANDGHYLDDTRCLRITEYTNMAGQPAYGLDYRLPTAYGPSPYIHNPKVIWEATRR